MKRSRPVGWNEKSLTSRVLQRMLNYSFNIASRTIVLDRFMKERVIAKGVDAARIAVVPPWSHDDQVQFIRQREGKSFGSGTVCRTSLW